jgi:hypothetical protein
MNLDFLFEFLNEEQPKIKLKENVEDYIFRVLTRSEFRLGIIDPTIKKMLREKIHMSVKENKPITLILAVGGFKNYRLQTAPHIDWAEVFQVLFVLKSLYEIALVYKPGLHLEYSGDAEAMVIANNLKQEWIDVYKREFDELIKVMSLKLPKNIKLTTKDFRDFYTIEEIETEVDSRLEKVDWESPSVKFLLKEKMPHAINNFCFNGRKNLEYLNKEEKQVELNKSIFKHKIWLDVDYERRREYLEGGINIPILHKANIPGCYAIKSCKGCNIQYWIGMGTLKHDMDNYVPTILSANQLVGLSDKLKAYKVDLNQEFRLLSAFKEIDVINT